MKKKELIEIVKNNINLKPLTVDQEDYFKSKLVNLATTTRGKFHCLECGYKSNKPYSLLTESLNEYCPNCGKKYDLTNNKKILFNDIIYCSIVEKFNKHIQVIRNFYVEKYATRSELPKYQISEVTQHWIEETGNNVYVEKPTKAFSGYCYDKWDFSEDLKINNHYNSGSYSRYRFEIFGSGSFTYPKISIIPILKRNGIKNSLYGSAPQLLFPALLKNDMVETLFKAKQYKLVNYIISSNYGYGYEKVKSYWSTIKICIRNNYIVKEVHDYFDHLKLLEQFEKDILNAYYVCPKDFNAEHQKYIRKEQKRIEKEKLDSLIKRISRDQKQYRKNRERFFNLELSNGKLQIIAIKHVKQLYEEATKLHHCAFTNSYHKKENCLLLSARYDGQVVETIDYNIRSFAINQSRGLENKPSEHHSQIISLIEQNNDKIKKLCQLKNTKKQSKVSV